MATEKATLVDLTGVFQKAVDALKAQPDRDKVDYYACDLVDQAVWLVCSWLLLRDTNALESKKSIARSYIASIAPRLRAAAGIVTESNAVPLEAIQALLA
jgi:Acyl-CoA dehydrogenase C terminal